MCSFSVMGLSMCSSIFSDSHRWGQNRAQLMSCPGFRTLFQLCYAATPASAGVTILHLLCRKTLVLSAEFGTKINSDLSTFIKKLLVFIKNHSTIHRADKMRAFFIPRNIDTGRILPKQNSINLLKMVKLCNEKNLDLRQNVYESSTFDRCRKAHCACILAPQHLCAATEVNYLMSKLHKFDIELRKIAMPMTSS